MFFLFKKLLNTVYSAKVVHLPVNVLLTLISAHGVGRVVGVLGSEAGFAGSMVISMMHVLHYHKNPKLQ